MPPIELRASTSFLFFVASAYIARQAIVVDWSTFACIREGESRE